MVEFYLTIILCAKSVTHQLYLPGRQQSLPSSSKFCTSPNSLGLLSNPTQADSPTPPLAVGVHGAHRAGLKHYHVEDWLTCHLGSYISTFHSTFALSLASADALKKIRTIIVGSMVEELSIKILSFSVHLPHISDVLVVLLAAAVLVCGREEHREQVPKVEKVVTDDNSSALGPIFMIFDVLESKEHDTCP